MEYGMVELLRTTLSLLGVIYRYVAISGVTDRVGDLFGVRRDSSCKIERTEWPLGNDRQMRSGSGMGSDGRRGWALLGKSLESRMTIYTK